MKTSPASAPVHSVERVCSAIDEVSDQLALMLSQVNDPHVRAVGVWSIAETAAHLSHGAPYFLAAAKGEAKQLEDLKENASATRAHVDADPERNLEILADRIRMGDVALISWARTVADDPPVQPFAGVELRLSGLLGVELGELLVHGHDIAQAAGLPWRIDHAHAILALDGVLGLLPALIDVERVADLNLSCEFRVRGGSPTLVVVDDGAGRLGVPGSGADCWVSADPVTLLLLAFNRIGPLGPLLTGKLVPGGRRPWQVPRLLSLVDSV